MNKNVNIQQRGDGEAYHAYFRVRERDPRTGTIRTAQVHRSTGSPDRKVAQAIANKMRSDALLGLFDAVPKMREESPTCGQIVDRYLATTRVKTARHVVQDFLTLVAEGTGARDREAAKNVRLSQLTAQAMLTFRDTPKATRSVSTTNALMRSGKSIFSRRAHEHYAQFMLPACVIHWMKVAFLKDSRTKATGFRQIPAEKLAAMDKGAGEMLQLATGADRNEWRNAWATYWLMRRCGLRNSEVAELRWEWFSYREDGTIWLDLVDRSYWTPKGSERSVPVARDLHQALAEEFRETRLAEGGYVLAGHLTDRVEGSIRRVNQYVRRWLPDRQKGAYELRKQWGSEMVLDYGIERASRLMGHKELKTTWTYYTDLLNLREVKPR